MSVKKTYPYIKIISYLGMKVNLYAQAPNYYHVCLNSERAVTLRYALCMLLRLLANTSRYANWNNYLE